MREPFRLIIWSVVLALAMATLLGLVSRVWSEGGVGWMLDLLSHWPKHLALAALVVGSVAGARRMRIAAGAAAAVVAVNGAMVIGLGGFAMPQTAPAGATEIRVVSANVHGSMAAVERVALLARDYGADVVALYEVPASLTAIETRAAFVGLPNLSLPSRTPDGFFLFRRSLLATNGPEAINVTTFDDSNGVILRTAVAGVQVVTTHPPSPGRPHLKWDRDRQLAQLGEGLDQAQPFLVMGDFNATPWSAAYGKAPGMRAGDPRFEGTFPAFLGPLGLPIDHIRFGGGLVLTDYRTGPDTGSDHLPLFATFALPGGLKASTR